LKLDKLETPFTPNPDQRELLKAQNYLIKLKEGKLNLEKNLADRHEKESYEKVFNFIYEKTNLDYFDAFLSEKGYDVKHFQEKNHSIEFKKTTKNRVEINKDITEIKEKIDEIIENNSLKDLKSVNYSKEYKQYQSNNLEPKTVKDKNRQINFKRI
jgi:hypothetical protein